MIAPPGPRQGGIPLLIGAGKPRMLRLVARYADMWNTVWLGNPEGLDERLARIRDACVDVGRDPSTLAITAGVEIVFPGLGDVRPMTQDPLSGSAEELAHAFQAYEQAGIAHLILHYNPSTLPAMLQVTEALRLYRSS